VRVGVEVGEAVGVEVGAGVGVWMAAGPVPVARKGPGVGAKLQAAATKRRVNQPKNFSRLKGNWVGLFTVII